MSDWKPIEGQLDPTFRNGTMTAVGIMLGFSLSFITAWATNPGPWQQADVLATIPLLVGIVFQTVSLAKLLQPTSLDILIYKHAMRLFMMGLIFTAAGVSIGIVVDILGLSHVSAVRHR